MSLSEAHKQKLLLKYGIPEEEIKSLVDREEVCSLLPDEVRSRSGRDDIDSSGLLFKYPGNGAFSIRLDTPPKDERGREIKYLHPKGEPNHLFNPGVNLSQTQDLWIVEGEAKALCGHAHGISIVALSGVYNWRTQGEEAELLAVGEKLKDEEALLPELAGLDWSGKRVTLLYDSDIVPGHRAYDAFPRLAEQLYRLGAEEVRILSLPPIAQGQKTGLDEFFLAKNGQALQDLQAMKDRREPYLPIRAGGSAYAERLIKSENLEDKQKAVIAYLGSKGEVFALDWLKRQSGLQSDVRKALLSEAKKRLAELQEKPRASKQGDLPELGPEYDTVKALLKSHLEEYDIDSLGRLGEVEWEDRKTKDGNKEFIRLVKPICNFTVWPIREILKDNGASQERFIELQGVLQGGANLTPTKVSLVDFLEKSTWAGQAWGARAAIKPYKDKEVRYCIQLMAQGGIPETIIYTHLGWRKIGDSWVYLHAGGAVGSQAIEVELTDRLRKYVLPKETGDLKEALKASLSLLELGPKRIMYPLLSLVYLAPLCESLRQAEIEPGFVTYLWGTTGSFKSTIIALLLSHFGTFEPKGLPASFRDTANSIEKLAFLAKDTLLAIDDLYPAKEPRERAKLEGVLEHLSRNQGDRTGKGRMKADTSLREGLPPRGLTLCSGEYQPLSGSSLARNLIIHLEGGDINQERLTQAQTQKGLLSRAMRGYLEWLAPQVGTLSGHVSKDFERLRESAKKGSKTRTRHRRLDETVAFLYLGLHICLNYAISQEALSQEQAVKILQDAWRTFNQVADELAQVAEREEPIKRFFEAIVELQAQVRVYFASMEDEIPDTANRTPGAEKIGWGPDGKGVYYFLYGPVWEAVTKYLRTQEERLPLSKSSLLDTMEQEGLLDRSQGNRRVIQKKIAGTKVRVLPVLEKAFSMEGDNETV